MSKVYEAIKRLEREREQTVRSPRRRGRLSDVERRLRLDPSAEEFQRLRTTLLSGAGYGELRAVMVGTPRHGDGATRVAVGLALALAVEQTTRVLLVEANLRSPSLATLLESNGGPGISDYLAGTASPEAIVQRREDLNLSCVYAGTKPAKIDCEAISQVVTRLGSQFDFTVVDVPPVNRYADATALAAKAEGIILVLAADRTPLVDAETAKRNLERAGARILGVVLNRRRSYIPAVLEGML